MKPSLAWLKRIAFIGLYCWVCSALQAQKATEVYIPLGASPGVSGKHSLMGILANLNWKDSVVSISRGGNLTTVRITSRTLIYLDNSTLKLPSRKGTFPDLKQGLEVELKYSDNLPGSPAEWIKVQPAKGKD